MSRIIGFALWSIVAVAASVAGIDAAVAGGGVATGGAPVACGQQLVTKTVMVPHMTYKTMTVPCVVYRPQVRQATVNVARKIAETQMVVCRQTVLVPEKRTKEVNYTVCRMAYEDVTSNVTVMVPQSETRQGTRTVCKPVQVQETATVCKDMGHWDTKTFVDCCGCQRSYQCWVPNVVTEKVPVTVWKAQLVEEPYTYQVVTCRPETKQVTHRVAKPTYENMTRNVTYTVAVPKLVERQVPHTTFRCVMEPKVVNYTEMVATKAVRRVKVPVCTMVPKQVTYAVSTCGGCGNCGW
jgi:hypothetical protein